MTDKLPPAGFPGGFCPGISNTTKPHSATVKERDTWDSTGCKGENAFYSASHPCKSWHTCEFYRPLTNTQTWQTDKRSRSWETIAKVQHLLRDIQKAPQCTLHALCVRQPERSKGRSKLIESRVTQQEPAVTHRVMERLWMLPNYFYYWRPWLCHLKNRGLWSPLEVTMQEMS